MSIEENPTYAATVTTPAPPAPERSGCDDSGVSWGSLFVEDSDDLLVARARAGDLSAFGRLVDRYYAHCLRYATRMLGDAEEAEDVVQEVLVRAFRSLRSYDERDRFRGWLLRILVNRCRTAARKRGRHRRLMERFALLHPARVEVPDDSYRLGIGEELARALEHLPADQREALLLHYVEDLSYPEMSRITGVGVSALKMRVSRAGERLRALLQGVMNE
jgi:RNA polymerase sigma-70 factor (ECF subfamily)